MNTDLGLSPFGTSLIDILLNSIRPLNSGRSTRTSLTPSTTGGQSSGPMVVVCEAHSASELGLGGLLDVLA